jgi:ribosomal subunit interface protein
MIEVEVTVRGEVDPEVSEYAKERIGTVDRLIDEPIKHARVVLTQASNTRIVQGSRAEAEIGLDDQIIRASVAGVEPMGAIDQLTQRLERKLRTWLDRRRDIARRGRERAAGEWREAQFSEARPRHFSRPPEEREVTRRKTFAATPLTPAEAAEEMEFLDHDFYLFTDAETGADAVAYHRDDGRLGVIGPSGIGWSGETDGIVHEESRISDPSELEAVVTEMNALNHRFMYFTNAVTERGNVIYLRYDGHYGLIEPAAP